jgi:flagellar biosynthesis protein FlhG
MTFLGRSPRLAGVIRRDDRVRNAIRRQTLFLTRHPTGPAAADVEATASFLLQA